jgi:hypothetical protein
VPTARRLSKTLRPGESGRLLCGSQRRAGECLRWVGTASSPGRSAVVRAASSGQRTRVNGNVGGPFMTGHRAVHCGDPVMTAMRPRPQVDDPALTGWTRCKAPPHPRARRILDCRDRHRIQATFHGPRLGCMVSGYIIPPGASAGPDTPRSRPVRRRQLAAGPGIE